MEILLQRLPADATDWRVAVVPVLAGAAWVGLCKYVMIATPEGLRQFVVRLRFSRE
jgi:hypothetical protein